MIGKFSTCHKSKGRIRCVSMFYIPMDVKVCLVSLMVILPIMTIFLLKQGRYWISGLFVPPLRNAYGLPTFHKRKGEGGRKRNYDKSQEMDKNCRNNFE